MKKLVSIILAAATAVSASAVFAGCSDENYPVNIIETSAMDGEFKNSCVIWKGEGE